MANTIKLKRGSGSDPGASDLSVGELAIRTDEGKIFTKKDDGSVAEISGGGGITDGDKGDITVSNSGGTWLIDTNAIDNNNLQDDCVGNGQIADNVVSEEKLKISNSGSNGQFLQKQSGNTGGFTWSDLTGSGASLTSLYASELTAGTVPIARLGSSGTASSSTYLRGDNTWASVSSYTHPNHSGEVTSSGDGATTIASNVVDEDNLKVSNSPTNGYFLSAQSGNTGGLTWAEVDLTALSASNLTSGTVAAARLDTATTQNAGNNSTKIATTAYADTAISNLVDSSPSALNTLNELAAALGDDANFSTTVTNSIATKLPLAGGTLTGNVLFNDNVIAGFGTGNDLRLWHNGSDSFITNYTGGGDLSIRNQEGNIKITPKFNEQGINIYPNAAVELYHDNVRRVETTSSGVTVTGTCTATTFSGSGASLTTLNASNLSSGTVATARLGSGTANSGVFLRGDGSWAAAGGVSSDSQKNTIAGTDAGSSLTSSGGYNTFFGYQAGEDAGSSSTSPEGNTAIGYEAGENITSSYGSTFVGYQAGRQVTSAGSNTAIGYRSLREHATGGTNTAVGLQASQYTEGASNTVIGYNAARYLKDGSNNVAVGVEACAGDSSPGNSGAYNIGVGYSALPKLTTGDRNIGLGTNAGRGITTADGNICIGDNAGYGLSTTEKHTLIGYESGKEGTISGSGNSTLGYRAGKVLSSGGQNVLIGSEAGTAVNTGENNTLIGYQAGKAVRSGDKNVIIGALAGDTNTDSSDNNIIIGYDTETTDTDVSNQIVLGNTNITRFRIPGLNFDLKDSTNTENYVLTVDANGQCGWAAASGSVSSTGSQWGKNVVAGTNAGSEYGTTDSGPAQKNVAVGDQAARYQEYSRDNVAIGYKAMFGTDGAVGSSDYAQDNIVIGSESGYKLETGKNNTIIGYKAGYTLEDGDDNILIGKNAGKNIATDRMYSVVIGNGAAEYVGQSTVTIGGGSGGRASQSVCVGDGAAQSSTSGHSGNVSIGYHTAKTKTDGTFCVHVGAESGTGNGTSTGSYNTTLGARCGAYLTSGFENTFLGYNAGHNTTTGHNQICIGNNAQPSANSVDNEVTIGDTNITKFRIPGINFELADNGGTPTNGHVLTMASGGATWQAASSGLSNIVEDTSPQLGGDLDANGYDIILDDDKALEFGNLSQGDLRIYHDNGGYSVILNQTGDLYIRGADSNKIRIQAKALQNSVVSTGDGNVELYYSGTKKLETTSAGVTVSGDLTVTGSAPSPAVADGCIYENSQTISNNYTMTTNKNGMSAGPITVSATVTIPSGSSWSIV